MSDELTAPQLAELKADLETLEARLGAGLELSAEGVRPVGLDEPIGRVSRMDAIQQQQMSASTRRAAQQQLSGVRSALSLIRAGEYGHCQECEEPIGFRRLKARPETRLCVACQSSRESRE